MSKAEQKLLLIQLNKQKLLAEAEKLDASIAPNDLTEDEIVRLVKEARASNASIKKEGS